MASPRPEQPTLGTLLRHSELHLRLVLPPDVLPRGALNRPLRWVHSSDLADPTPFLADDLALLTTGMQFAQRAAAHQTEYVRRLAKRDIVGLGFGRDVALPEIPATLLAACAEAGIPLFEVPYQTPFIAVARAHADAIAAARFAQRAQLRGQRRRLHAQLLASLLRDDPELASRVLGGLPAEPIVVAVTDATIAGDALEDWWREREVFFAQSDAGSTVCLSAEDAESIAGAARHFGIRFGVSAPARYNAFARAHGEALAALGRGSAPVTRFTDQADLLQAMLTDEAQLAASALLAPLRDAPGNLANTLRVWLAHDAKLEPAAAELGIHRHTLRTRIAQAATLLGRDLATFPARAEVWAALHAIAHRP